MEYFSVSDPDYNLWLSMRRAHEAIHKIRKIELRPYKITTAETAVLLTISRNANRITPAEISRQLLKDHNSISQLITRMEKRGLLASIKGSPRKNMVTVQITDRGREAFNHSMEGKKVTEVMAVLSEQEREQLFVCLNKLREKALEILP